jgi:uncharacterized protein (DUF1330 family)
MAAYCFFDVHEITDSGAMDAYRARVRATVEAHGGRYVLVGGTCEVVEGDWRPVFPVIIEFPSLAQARAWYDSPEYAPLKAQRLGATRGGAVFMEGLPPEYR